MDHLAYAKNAHIRLPLAYLLIFALGNRHFLLGGLFMIFAKMKKQKPPCKYGDKCYRQNPQHFRDYSHGSQSESEVKVATAIFANWPLPNILLSTSGGVTL